MSTRACLPFVNNVPGRQTRVGQDSAAEKPKLGVCLALVGVLLVAGSAPAQIVAPAGRTLFNRSVMILTFVRVDHFAEIQLDGQIRRLVNPYSVVWGVYPNVSLTFVTVPTSTSTNALRESRYRLVRAVLERRVRPRWETSSQGSKTRLEASAWTDRLGEAQDDRDVARHRAPATPRRTKSPLANGIHGRLVEAWRRAEHLQRTHRTV